MFEALRKKLREGGPVGIAVAVAALVIGLAVVFFSARRSFGPSAAARHNAERVYICAETGKAFTHRVEGTKILPVMSPHSGKETGYPAQHCYWTKEGTLKQEPTYVLMNQYKNERGPTFCPDCDRLVPADNPVATADTPPPPTREEHTKRRGDRKRDGQGD